MSLKVLGEVWQDVNIDMAALVLAPRRHSFELNCRKLDLINTDKVSRATMDNRCLNLWMK